MISRFFLNVVVSGNKQLQDCNGLPKTLQLSVYLPCLSHHMATLFRVPGSLIQQFMALRSREQNKGPSDFFSNNSEFTQHRDCVLLTVDLRRELFYSFFNRNGKLTRSATEHMVTVVWRTENLFFSFYLCLFSLHEKDLLNEGLA